MKNFLKPLLVFLSICSLLPEAAAQKDNPALITASFNKATFEEFVKEAESQTKYQFYYNPAQTDSILISASFKQEPLEQVMEKAMAESGLEFSADVDLRSVFITKEKKIISELPPGFSAPEKKVKEEKSDDQFVVDYFDAGGKKTWEKKEKLYEIGQKTRTIKAGNATISGQVRNAHTGEAVLAASVFVENPFIGATSDAFGNFSISVPKGPHTLKVRSMGMLDEEYKIVLYSDGKLDIGLTENVVSLKEVEVRADRDLNVSQAQMGSETVNIKAIKQVPSIMGEPDVLRVVLTLPGVKSVGEASTGFNVRGGSADQNLILFNDATVYNPTHLFGFFSAFNSDVTDGVELYKSSVPAKYGGRLSSVLEVSPRYGNKKKVEGKAGIGLLTSRFTLEGPILKDRTSFIIGGRATYSNWILRMLKNEEYRNSKGSFYDVNVNLTHEINEKSNLYFTGYFSRDEFKLRSDTIYGYDNKNATLKWKNIFSNKLIGTFSGSVSQYGYTVRAESNPVNAYNMAFDIGQVNMHAGFSYSYNARHTFNYGVTSVYYKLKPGSFLPASEESEVRPDILEAEQAVESAFYIEDQFDITDNLSLKAGLRYSLYNYLGPKEVISYAAGLPRNESNMLDTIPYGQGDVINTYHGPEIRVSARYRLTNSFSVKAGYNTLRQYIHMLSNTTAIAPTDIWKLSDPNLRPQFGEQTSLGFYKNLRNGQIETSVEGYYKNIRDYLDYKAGAELIMNHSIEKEVVNTSGKAYGVEFMVKKNSGKLNGWLSYTWSRTLLRMNDPTAGELINRGEWYPANYDKPHDFTFIGNYKFSHRFSVSVNTTYSTGRPITLPIAKYEYAGSPKVLYSDRNAFRIPDYFRTDFAMNIDGNHKVHQKTHNSWSIGVYNLTGRRNVYSTYFISENGSVNGYKMSIFGSAIPYVNFNIRF